MTAERWLKRSLLVLLASLLTAGNAAAQRVVNRKIWVAPNGFIRLWNLAGSVRVVGWDQDSLSITGSASWTEPGELVISPGKQGAKVSLWGPDARSARGVLLVRVPRRSQLWIKTQDADISVSEFEGGLDLMTVSGNVEVSGRPRELYAESMGGNVNLSLTTRSARVKTGSGAVTLRGVVDDAAVSTVSGAVHTLDSRIRQGRFESIEGKLSYWGDFAAPASLEFINHAGAIELALTPHVAGQFSISTFEGSFRDEFGLRVQQGSGKSKGKEFSFTLGGKPDTEVSVRTFKGAVVVRKFGPVKVKA